MTTTGHSARYDNEMFATPQGAATDSMNGDGMRFDADAADKIYRYGPTREIEVAVFKGDGVQVTYGPTCRVVSWDWHNRNMAFAWAQERGQHMRALNWR